MGSADEVTGEADQIRLGIEAKLEAGEEFGGGHAVGDVEISEVEQAHGTAQAGQVNGSAGELKAVPFAVADPEGGGSGGGKSCRSGGKEVSSSHHHNYTLYCKVLFHYSMGDLPYFGHAVDDFLATRHSAFCHSAFCW